MTLTLGSLAAPSFDYWRVQSNGLWHRVQWWMFHYSEARNENHTFCGLRLDNPPFADLTPRWDWNPPKDTTPPEPACPTCEAEYPKAKRDDAVRMAAWWAEKASA